MPWLKNKESIIDIQLNISNQSPNQVNRYKIHASDIVSGDLSELIYVMVHKMMTKEE